MDTRSRFRRLAVIAAGAVALGAGVLAAAGPAQAAASHPGVIVASQTMTVTTPSPDPTAVEYAIRAADAAPNVCGPSNAWVAMLGDNVDVYLCGVATAPTAGLGPFFDITSTVRNRIWLHQNANNSGWADCRRGPGEWLLSGRDANPGNIQVSANTAAC